MQVIKPYTNEELSRLPRINDTINNAYTGSLENNASVLGSQIFTGNRKDYEENVEHTEKFSKFGAIALKFGILNPLLGAKGQVWAMALGIKPAEVMELAHGSIVYDAKEGALIKPNKASTIDKTNFLVGGDALLYMLEERLKNNSIEDDLKHAIVQKFLRRFCKKNEQEILVKSLYKNGKQEDHVFGEWYFPFSKFGLTKSQVMQYNTGIEFKNSMLNREDLNDISREVQTDIAEDEDEGDVYYVEDDFEEEYYVDADEGDEYDTAESSENWQEYLANQNIEEVGTKLADAIAGLGEVLGENSPTNGSDFTEEIDDSIVKESDVSSSKTRKNNSVSVSQYEMITILETLLTEGGIHRLKSTVMKFLPVLPYGYRTTFTGKNSPYTILYDSIYTKVDELQYLVTSPEDFCATYSRIYHMIRCLYLGDSAVQKAFRFKDYKPFVTSLSGKKGKIRLYTEGGRFDYTGRSVIVSSPEMPIDTVGMPLEVVAMLFVPKLAKRFLDYLSKKEDAGDIRKEKCRNIHRTINAHYSEYLSWVQNNARHLEKSLYVYIGRQPSLHYLSMQPYRVRILVNDDTFVLSPTIVEPFNADFDGDQMHSSAVLTKEAWDEIHTNELLSQQPKRKPNGEIGSKPRLEMVYGLYMAFNAINAETYETYTIEEVHNKLKEEGKDRYESVNETLMQALSCSLINVEDHINNLPASIQALNYILNGEKIGSISTEDFERYFSNDRVNIDAITNTLSNRSRELVVKGYSDLVRFTYGIAKRHLINASITEKYPELRSYILDEVEKFNKRMYERKTAVDLGLMSTSAYDMAYSIEWGKVQKKIDEELARVLPSDNGYRVMKDTGAKGSKDTIRQIYAVKGQIEQVLDRPFNCIIENSYANKLTGMQHFCTAYGARKGISDKVLATSKPGYLARKLNHAGATVKISKHDCGTKSGLDYTILDIAPLLDEVDQRLSWYFWTQDEYNNAKSSAGYQVIYATCKEKMAQMLIGRNCVYSGSTVYIATQEEGIKLLDLAWGKDFPKLVSPIEGGKIEYVPIIVRSPITCECPCCQVCYGFDWTLNKKEPTPGKQIGFIAAQAISEPGTQMTMKNFQRAGVVSGANLTSAFDIIEAYFDLRGRTHSSKIPYDFVSPVDGKIEVAASVGYNRLLIRPIENIDECAEDVAKGDFSSVKLGSNCVLSHIYIDSTIELKRVVHKGEPVQVFCGNIDVKQALTSWSCLKVAKYLTLRLTQIYSKSSVRSIYIETILAGMLLGRILKDVTIKVDGNIIKYPAGSTISRSLLAYAISDLSNVEIQWFLVGIKQLPKYKPDSMESIIMESLSTYLPRAAVIQPYDSGLNPISTLLMGDERFGGDYE